MSLIQGVVVVVGLVMIVGFVLLILLWAVTEALPQSGRVPLYEQLEAGDYGVRLIGVGRRRAKSIRVINEVLGGDIGMARTIVESAPVTLIEGISESVARTIIAELVAAGAQAELLLGEEPVAD